MARDRLMPGLRDELFTEDLTAFLAALDQEQLDSDPLRASDAVERLGKHLLRVARRLRNPSDIAAVEATVTLMNTRSMPKGRSLPEIG